MVTSGSLVAAFTRSPTCTVSRPVRPEIGARIEAYSRLSRAFATAPSRRAPSASQASAAARFWSHSASRDQRSARAAAARARRRAAPPRACARSRASAARACSSAARNGRGSSSNSTWPAAHLVALAERDAGDHAAHLRADVGRLRSGSTVPVAAQRERHGALLGARDRDRARAAARFRLGGASGEDEQQPNAASGAWARCGNSSVMEASGARRAPGGRSPPGRAHVKCMS